MKKAKQSLLVVCIMAAMMQPFLSKSQNLSYKETPVAPVGWQPIKLDDKGVNVQNGVEFYRQKGDCPYGIIILLKLINTNNYPVKVSYQLGEFSPVVNIMIAASTTIEGSCSDTEGNLSKLIIRMPETEDAKKKTREYLHTHITVSKVQ